MKRSTRRLLREADKAIREAKTLADALRLEAMGLGRVFFEGGKPTWYPLTVKL